MKKVWILVVVLAICTLGDAYTTWACLTNPTPEYSVTEANPGAAYLFSILGVGLGLTIETAVGILFLGWFGRTRNLNNRIKAVLLSILIIATSWATWNNYEGMVKLGIA